MKAGCWVIVSALSALSTVQADEVMAFRRVFNEATVNGVSGIHETFVAFGANQTVTISTDSLVALGTGSADTVMHVQSVSNSSWPGMSNDDCQIAGVVSQSLASCVRFTSPTDGIVRVTVHGFRTSSVSVGVFKVQWSDGSVFTEPGIFGGHVLGFSAAENVGWNPLDVFEIVRPPTSLGPGASYRALLIGRTSSCASNSVELIARSVTTDFATRITPGISSSGFCYPLIVVGSTRALDIDRSARVYVNDRFEAEADPDGDGLGTELEEELMTCPSMAGPAQLCSHARNAADTDADGLWDGWEVLGRSVAGTAVRLPTWGANPRRMDLFVEFDWDSVAYGSASPAAPSRLLTEAAKFATPGTSLVNPDGSSGIFLHFDVGKSSCDSDLRNCSPTYGAWGGAGPTNASGVVGAFGLGQFSQSRRGMMLYGLFCEGCGAAYNSASMKMTEVDPEGLIAHEIGHLLGLDHAGPYLVGGAEPLVHNCEPNYLSTMNYTYKFSALGFSRGDMPELVSAELIEASNPGIPAALLATWAELGLVTDSVIDWNRDGVISPTTVRGTTRYAAVDNCNVSDVLPVSVRLDTGDYTVWPELVPAMLATSTDLAVFAVTRSTLTGATRLRNIHFNSILRPCNQYGSPRGCCPRSVNGSNLCGSWSSASSIPLQGVIDSSPVVVEDRANGLPRRTLVYASVLNGVRRFVAREILGLGAVGPEVVVLSGGAGFLTNPNVRKWADPSVLYVDSAPVGRKLQLFYTTSSGQARRLFLSEGYGLTEDQALQRQISPVLTGPLSFSNSLSATSTATGIFVTSVESEQLVLWSIGSTASLATQIQQLVQGRTYVARGRPTILGHDPASSVDLNHGLEIAYVSDNALFSSQPHRSWVSSTTMQFSIGAGTVDAGGSGGATLARYRGRMVMGTRCVKRCGAGSTAHDLQLFPFSTGVYTYPDTDSDDYAVMGSVLCEAVKFGFPSIECDGASCNDACAIPQLVGTGSALAPWPDRHCGE